MTTPGRPSDATTAKSSDAQARMPPSRFTASYPAPISAPATTSERAPVRQIDDDAAVAGQLVDPGLQVTHGDPHRLGRVPGIPFISFAHIEQQRAVLDHLLGLRPR